MDVRNRSKPSKRSHSERLTTAKVKDPKKQEAGRKGAAAELTAAKEAVFSCKATNNEEHAVDTKASKTRVSSEPKTTESSSGEAWSVGIGLAVAAGVVLFAVKQFSQQTSTTCSWSMFDME